MTEWIEARIFFNEGKKNEVLVNLLKPLIQRLKSTFNIVSYHFLFEPEIWFRVLTIPENVDKIKGLINNLQQNEHVREVIYPEIPYEGERQSFGEDGWKTTYKFLEVGSDFALDLLDENVRRGTDFNRFTFSHLFLNQQGFNQFQEASFHFECSMERMFVIIDELKIKPLRLKITQLKNRIRELEPQEEEEQPTQRQSEEESTQN